MAHCKQPSKYDVSFTSDSDFVSEMFCESCKKDNKYSKAEGFCVDCADYFCTTCLKFHERFLPHHVQQDQYTMPQDFCLEACQVHPNEVIKYFCEHCETFACIECKHNHHKNCEKLTHVPQLVQHLESTPEFKLFKRKLITSEESLVNITELLIPSKYTQVETCYNKARSVVSGQSENIMHKISDCEKRIQADIETIRLDDTKQLDSVLTEINAVKSKCESLRRSVEIMQTSEQRSKLFITMKNAKDLMTLFETSIAEVGKKSKTSKYLYTPDTYLHQTMEELEEMGSLVKDGVKTTAFERHRIRQNYDQHKKDLFQGALESRNIKNACTAVNSFIDDWKKENINIAVVGVTGSGKSTFINSMCEVDLEDSFAAAVGVTETTTLVTPYALGRNRNVILFDFPGVGAKMFPKEKYLKLIDFNKFDIFILLFSMRWTETDTWLASAIGEYGKTLYIIRTHFDCDLENECNKRRKGGLSVAEETTLKTAVLSTCHTALKNIKSKQKLFIVNGLDLNCFDYEDFERMLIADALEIRESKGLAIIFSLPRMTDTAKTEKKFQLERRLSEKALQAAISLPSSSSFARCLIEEKELYIRQMSIPIQFPFDLNTELSKAETELTEMENRLYHKHILSGVDALFKNGDQKTEPFLPFFDIVQTYTVCRVWLKKTFDSVVVNSINE